MNHLEAVSRQNKAKLIPENPLTVHPLPAPPSEKNLARGYSIVRNSIWQGLKQNLIT